jgi:hypothetical protein
MFANTSQRRSTDGIWQHSDVTWIRLLNNLFLTFVGSKVVGFQNRVTYSFHFSITLFCDLQRFSQHETLVRSRKVLIAQRFPLSRSVDMYFSRFLNLQISSMLTSDVNNQGNGTVKNKLELINLPKDGKWINIFNLV